LKGEAREAQPSTAPSAAAEFRGWIPTVSGRLSFSIFGRTLFPSRARFGNVSDGASRFLVVYQQHDASDIILPFRRVLAPYFVGRRGAFTFVLVAASETTPEDEAPQFWLTGAAFIFSDDAVWRETALPEIDDYIRELRAYHAASHSQLAQYANHSFNRVLDVCRSHCCFQVSVKISRRGRTEIVAPFPNAVATTAPRLPDDPNRRENIIHVLAAQIFFFLKNIGHHHQHHDPSTDTIVDLYRYSETDDINWRRNVLYSMYRAVIERKRIWHSTSFNDCIGVIAYAETFREVCKEELGDKANELPKYYGINAANSIRSTQSRVERELLVTQRRQDLIRNTLLAILSIVLSFSGLLKLTKTEIHDVADPSLLFVAGWIVSHFVPTICIFALLIFILSVYSRIGEYRISRRLVIIMRLIYGMPRPMALAVLTTLTVILGAGAVLVLTR
jgi:hypothetical protein